MDKDLFKKEHSFAKRAEISGRLKNKYPKHIPIIVELDRHSSNLLVLQNHKFLAPSGSTMGTLLLQIRDRCKLRPEEALYLFCGNSILIPTSYSLDKVYEKYADEDGFLYIQVALENTFGDAIVGAAVGAAAASIKNVLANLEYFYWA